MKVLSFDIGIVNMAYCVLDKDTKEITHWEVFSLVNSTDIENTKDLVRQLDKRPHIFDNVGIVLIERQPKVNPKMKKMASSLRTYMVIRGMVDKNFKFHVVDYSPKHKLMCWDGPVPKITVKSEYGRRKKLGIFQCEQLIKNQPQEIQVIYKGAQSKKDDLADCFLQGLSYIMFEHQKLDSTSKIIKRKPTSKQIKYNSLSKSNLKYLFDDFLNKNIEDEGALDYNECLEYYLKFNHRLNKKIDKFYGTQTERVSELIADHLKKKRFKVPQPPPKKKRCQFVDQLKDKEEFEENS